MSETSQRKRRKKCRKTKWVSKASVEQTAVRYNDQASAQAIAHLGNIINQQNMMFLQGLREQHQASLLSFEKLCSCQD